MIFSLYLTIGGNGIAYQRTSDATRHHNSGESTYPRWKTIVVLADVRVEYQPLDDQSSGSIFSQHHCDRARCMDLSHACRSV
jgi:hypothetical protein